MLVWIGREAQGTQTVCLTATRVLPMSALSSERRVSQAPLLGEARVPALSPPTSSHAGLVMTVGLAVAFLWSYGPILRTLADRFWHDPQYSHGFLVPVFSLV